jgi:toxin FitB
MAGIILDTNVISVVAHEKENNPAREWYFAQNENDLYLTSVTLAEITQGIWRLEKSHSRRAYYMSQLDRIETQFGDRILPFDRPAARLWGQLRGEHMRRGRILPELDTQIAAIALRHGMSVATGNTKHFAGLGLDLIDPAK